MMLDGYEKLWSIGIPYQTTGLFHFKFSETTYQQDYELFVKRILDSVGRCYLPIYRMADGEFIFSLKRYSRRNALFSRFNTGHPLFSTCWGEGYSRKEIDLIFPAYIEHLRKIARHGMLAIHFIESKEQSYAALIKPMMEWFDEYAIEINETNYTSFYYLYALFSGPFRRELLENKSVLIISHTLPKKESAIRERLIHLEHMANVEFYNISPDKSFFDRIDLTSIRKRPDLVLIGAGVGSANIITQLEPLETACIDAGIVLDLFANPDLRFSRIFLNYPGSE